MFRKYEKTYRILVPQISTKGKHYLSDVEVSRLMGGNVVLLEKLDGANVGIIRHKNEFRLQKRGSLVDASEHFQFNFFKAWTQLNYDKLMQIPQDTILYGELMICKHTIFYDKLPDYFIPFAWLNRSTETYYHYDDMSELCNKLGLTPAPEIARGHFRTIDLFDMIPNPSNFGSTTAEGLVVWNYKKGLRGKIVREQFQKSMDHTGHWERQPVVKNLLRK